MSDLAWGLQMMLVGMGVVFALLILLMVVLMATGRLDRPRVEAEPTAPESEALPASPDSDTPTPSVRVVADGLDEAQLAAIAIAVMTHAEVRRRSAGPETRAHAPGSQLFASRWVSIGRGQQHTRITRR